MFHEFRFSSVAARSAAVALCLVALTGVTARAVGTGDSAGSAIKAQAVTISAPETVDPGQTVSISIGGALSGGRIELWGPVTDGDRGAVIESAPVSAGAASLAAPTTPGTYELRYVEGANSVRARTNLDVAAIPIILSIPAEIGAGYDTEIEWRGPGYAGDMIQIYDPSSRSVVSQAPASGRPGALNVTVLRAPERTGAYEVRYWNGRHRVVVRSLPVTVGKGLAWLRSPIEVFKGERFQVEWHGPSGDDLRFELFDPETGTVLASQKGERADGQVSSATFTAPKRAGQYRVRYVNAETGFVISDLPLDVDPK